MRTTAVVVASALLLPIDALAQASKAGVVTTLHGTATVARATAPEPAPLKFKDDVFVQDRIVTGENSAVRILLGGKAVVTVRERSTLTITETPTTSTVEVGSGKIALAVAKDRMKPGESVEIKTPNAVAGVRGTVVIAEVSPAPGTGGGFTSHFTLLTGIVDVTMVDRAGQPNGSRVTLSPLQGITVTDRLGAIRDLRRDQARSVASDYKVSIPPPPKAANTQLVERQIEKAVQNTAVLVGTVQNPVQGPTASTSQGGEEIGAGSVSTGTSGNNSNSGNSGKNAGSGKGGGIAGASGGGVSISGGGSVGGSVGGGSIGGGLVGGGAPAGGGPVAGGGSIGGGALGGGGINTIIGPVLRGGNNKGKSGWKKNDD